MISLLINHLASRLKSIRAHAHAHRPGGGAELPRGGRGAGRGAPAPGGGEGLRRSLLPADRAHGGGSGRDGGGPGGFPAGSGPGGGGACSRPGAPCRTATAARCPRWPARGPACWHASWRASRSWWWPACGPRCTLSRPRIPGRGGPGAAGRPASGPRGAGRTPAVPGLPARATGEPARGVRPARRGGRRVSPRQPGGPAPGFRPGPPFGAEGLRPAEPGFRPATCERRRGWLRCARSCSLPRSCRTLRRRLAAAASDCEAEGRGAAGKAGPGPGGPGRRVPASAVLRPAGLPDGLPGGELPAFPGRPRAPGRRLRGDAQGVPGAVPPLADPPGENGLRAPRRATSCWSTGRWRSASPARCASRP